MCRLGIWATLLQLRIVVLSEKEKKMFFSLAFVFVVCVFVVVLRLNVATCGTTEFMEQTAISRCIHESVLGMLNLDLEVDDDETDSV
jgi:hypothetical protein